MANIKSTRIRFIAIALALIAFPLLVVAVFYSSRNLVPSLAKFQFTLPFKAGSTTTIVVETTAQRNELNASAPAFLRFSLPHIPSLTYADILLLVAVIIVGYVSLQAFMAVRHRRSIKPLSDIDELIEERAKVASILDETVRKLNLGSNYRDTVLKCYKLIAETLEARSSINGKTLTASEFRDIVSRKLQFDSQHLARVTCLFEIARYSQNEITQGDANEAMSCLSSLSSELKAKNDNIISE
jgi:hypothetical protein